MSTSRFRSGCGACTESLEIGRVGRERDVCKWCQHPHEPFHRLDLLDWIVGELVDVHIQITRARFDLTAGEGPQIAECD